MRKLHQTVRSLFSFRRLAAIVLFLNFHSVTLSQDHSLDFDGIDNFVTIPNLQPSGSYTKEAWVNFRTLSAVSGNIVSGTNSAFWAPSGNLSAGHNGDYGSIADAGTMSTGTWYHVAVTYDEGTNTMILYRDGVQVATGNPAGTHSETNLYIGTFSGGSSLFDGQMDEVRLWGVVRTPTEIANSRNCSLTGEEEGLLAYYTFNQGTAGGNNAGVTTLLDVSERCTAQNGTLSGFTLSGASSNWVDADPGVTGSCGGVVANARLIGNSVCIDDGDVTPSLADHTDFGQGSTIVRTFTIQNTGTATMNVGNVDIAGPDAARFTVTSSPAATIAAGGSTTFDITFQAIANGVRTATITVNNADGDLPYDFDVQAAIFNLPVDLQNFNARKNGTQSLLTWTTVTESNNRGFEVQRSKDGVNWTVIGFVQGAGNSSSEITYSYTDPMPLKGINSYRLRQVDFDNRSKFSEVRPVTFASETTMVYPVPTNDKVTIELKDSKLIGTIAIVSDQQGKTVQRLTINNMQQQVSLAALRDGVYFLKLEDGTSYKLVKQ